MSGALVGQGRHGGTVQVQVDGIRGRRVQHGQGRRPKLMPK